MKMGSKGDVVHENVGLCVNFTKVLTQHEKPRTMSSVHVPACKHTGSSQSVQGPKEAYRVFSELCILSISSPDNFLSLALQEVLLGQCTLSKAVNGRVK